MQYFISDTHFGHVNSLQFDHRPFSSVKEQDKIMTERWNAKVTHEDDVYILGDVSWYSAEETVKLLRKLNGKKHLIKGNHDNKLLRDPQFRQLFVEITDYKELYISNNRGVVLSHYPILCYNHHRHSGWYHLYGHVHNSMEWDFMEQFRVQMEYAQEIPCRIYNVGAMIPYMNYEPRTLDEILSGYHEYDVKKKEGEVYEDQMS